jgi:hypothetical protein
MQHQLVERTLEIARKRRKILEQLRLAIKAGDKDSVVKLATQLTGITDEECHRINSRIN